MKTLKSIIVALSILITSSAFATDSATANTPEAVAKEITTLLNNPSFLVVENQTVAVEFILNKDKEVVVLSVDCNDAEVCTFISERLNRRVLRTSLEQGKVYTLPVKFVSKD